MTWNASPSYFLFFMLADQAAHGPPRFGLERYPILHSLLGPFVAKLIWNLCPCNFG
jgi:hypothetical protein